MKKTRRFMTAAMAAALAAIMPISALAQTNTGATGGTSFGIVQTTTAPANVSFELPLYVTMAVVTDSADVVMPSDYKIKNLAATDGSGYSIKVTGMEVEKLTGSTFSLTTNNAPTSATDINMVVGGVTLPNVSQAGIPAAVTLTSTPFDTLNISPGADHNITLVGKVANTTRTAVDAAAQFKITYTVSAVNASGALIGGTYAGDSALSAGF